MTGQTQAATGPGPIAQALDAVTQSLRAGDRSHARLLAGQALAEGREHPLFLRLRAMDHQDGGRLEQALADLRRAHVLSPQDDAVLNDCGLCLTRMDRLQEALRCFDQAIGLNQEFEQAWFNRGWVLERIGEKAKAAEAYAQAVKLNPTNALAWALLAYLAARRADAPGARKFAERALDLKPGEPIAILALAEVELVDPPVAERRLRGLLAQTELPPFDRARALNQLGDVLDAADRPMEAFEAYAQANRLFREPARAEFEPDGHSVIPDTLAWLIPWVETRAVKGRAGSQRAHRVQDGGQDGGRAGHVFLMGFPRSGTTLMESVLAAHPRVISLEERDTLQAGAGAFMETERDLNRLYDADEQALRPYRADYWSRVRSFGVDPTDRIFIDKNPFNTLALPLIHRLFPAARIIFAIRDPRDVVLSCFRRRFGLNPSTYELLDLERAAAFYDGAMRFAEGFRKAFEFPEHRLVYERLVDDFAAQARAACDFIGAEWRDDLIDFAGRAKRGEIASASSVQIARGLYSGAGQWRRYAAALDRVLPRLQPWIEAYGYDRDDPAQAVTGS